MDCAHYECHRFTSLLQAILDMNVVSYEDDEDEGNSGVEGDEWDEVEERRQVEHSAWGHGHGMQHSINGMAKVQSSQKERRSTSPVFGYIF